jgi:hypothetical protein
MSTETNKAQAGRVDAILNTRAKQPSPHPRSASSASAAIPAGGSLWPRPHPDPAPDRARTMFLDCPAYLDQDGTRRCGLPAEVRCRFTMRSTGGPLESAMIRCPAGHWFNGTIESFTWEHTDKHDPGTAPGAHSARQDSRPGTHDGPDSTGRSASRDFPAELQQKIRCPNGAPAYYLGRPARLWITAMRPHRSRGTSSHPIQAVTGGENEHTPDAVCRDMQGVLFVGN